MKAVQEPKWMFHTMTGQAAAAQLELWQLLCSSQNCCVHIRKSQPAVRCLLVDESSARTQVDVLYNDGSVCSCRACQYLCSDGNSCVQMSMPKALP